ncbi:receptor for retinol uptake stra6-like [Halichondria panicea]|uniref:receptor for retinol uptake stra6-like n=1 Tax=Halichondria panicea TaxID=6063 RepID=UPI00312BC0E4
MEEELSTASTAGYGLQWPWPVYTTEIVNLSNSSASVCIEERSLGGYLEISVLCSAALIIVVLNLILPRWRERTLQGWTQLVVPVKFLDSTRYRVIYCMALSAWAGDVLKSVSDSTQFIRHKDNALLDAFYFFILSPTVIILKQTLAYFPVLACVDGPLPLLSHTLGCLHTLLLGSHSVYSESLQLRGCSPKGVMTTRDMVFSGLISAPVYVIYLIVGVWFLFQALLELPLVLCTRHKAYQSSHHDHGNQQSYDYVQGLLKKRWRPAGRMVVNMHTLCNYLKRGLKYVLPYHGGYRYPLPFVSAISMAVLITYQLGLSLGYASVSYTEQLMRWVREFNITVETIEHFFPQLKPRVDSIFYDAKSLILAFNIIIPLSVFISFAMSLGFLMYMVQQHHKLMVGACRGELSFLVSSEPLPSLSYRLAATMRYSAFQFSYIVFTWMVYFFMMASLMCFGLIFYILFKNGQNFGVHVWAWFMVPLMWGAVMHLVQGFLCHVVFLKDKTVSKTGFVPLRFKSLYQILSFIFFFFNVIYGIVMCFLRVFAMVMFTIVMLFRIDRDVYMRGLEGWDVGYRTFIGYMYMEVTNNHPVVRTFLALLQETTPSQRTSLRAPSDNSLATIDLTSSASPSREANGLHHRHTNGGLSEGVLRNKADSSNRLKDITRVSKSRRARNRWLVAYTLLRNPALRTLTASSLRQLSSSSVNDNCYGTF